MSALEAVRCTSCGGAVAVRAGTPMPVCLFCGGEASDLVPYEPPEGIEPPQGAIPFAVDDATAREAFRTFARSSFWYPRDLRNARLELRHLLLPAWAWSGEVETHWTGLVRASTRSGKRPVAGAENRRFEQVLVPASQSLTLAELGALGAFDEDALAPFEPADAADPYEVSEVTRSAARARAQDEMSKRHRATIVSARSLVKCSAASVCTELDGRPVLVPVYIGAYRYGDGLYRVLVNGQSGAFHGTAPISWWRVAFVVLAVGAAVAALLGLLMVCSGGLAVISSL